MPDKHRWLVSELRARGFKEDDCYKEEGVAVTVRKNYKVTAVFYLFWFERRWYMGSCAKWGVTYLLPDAGDVVAACVAWARGWKRTPPTEILGCEAPPKVVARFGLKQLSRKEITAWFKAMAEAIKRLLVRLQRTEAGLTESELARLRDVGTRAPAWKESVQLLEACDSEIKEKAKRK